MANPLPKAGNYPEIMTRKQVCEYLGGCLNKLRTLRIPHVREGQFIRYRKSVIDGWLKEREAPHDYY